MSNSNAASPREPPSPPSSHIAHAPEPSTARPQLPQASALTESHSTLHHQNVRPHLHFALFLAAWMIQWHFSICGRWRAGTCHSPTPIGGVPRPRRPWAATYGCCRWLLARPQSHWSTVLPDPGSVLIPELACAFAENICVVGPPRVPATREEQATTYDDETPYYLCFEEGPTGSFTALGTLATVKNNACATFK